MIDKALNFLLEELNSFLGRRFQSNETLVVLSSLVNPDGTAPLPIENKIVLTLANVERESAAANSVGLSRAIQAPSSRVSPPLNLNLYVLVAANFGNNYAESIKSLSHAVAFFQAKPVFTAQGSATFPRELQRLSFEMVNLDFSQLNNLWAAQGAKYLPSVVYKVRMVTIQESWVTDRVPGISGTDFGN